MTHRVGAALILTAILACASQAFAQSSNAAGRNGPPARGGAKAAVWLWCEISADGHQWRALATNTTGRDYKCDFKCALRTEKGPSSRMSCSPNVPAGAKELRVCGGSDNGKTWTGIADPGAHSCR